jgi:hypothetical protein
MIELPITPGDIERVRAAANGRQDFAQQHNLQTPGVQRTSERRRRDDFLGCIGELKSSQYFGLEFNADVGVLNGVDCKIFEVRARRIESGRDLAITPNDKWQLPYVLVWIDRERMIATLVGWLCGWQGHQRAMDAKREAGGTDVWWQPLKAVWFIPPPYHSVQSLRDWIDCGHPLHWCPEEYR